jgi:hypothetical protein
MVEGLRESCAFVNGLIEEAVREMGKGNLVVGGLSQGCATVLTAMMLGGRALGEAE